MDRFFVDAFLDAYPKPRKTVILDFNATDDPLHGEQEGRFFHGYYGCYWYLPLYVFCDEHLLCARLRPSNIDAAKGSLVRPTKNSPVFSPLPHLSPHQLPKTPNRGAVRKAG